jgi:hypothetical protein
MKPRPGTVRSGDDWNSRWTNPSGGSPKRITLSAPPLTVETSASMTTAPRSGRPTSRGQSPGDVSSNAFRVASKSLAKALPPLGRGRLK